MNSVALYENEVPKNGSTQAAEACEAAEVLDFQT